MEMENIMVKRKTIVFITGSLSNGGAERVISILASGCADMGHDVTLVVLRSGVCSYNVSNNVRIIQIEEDGKKSVLGRVLALRNVLKKKKCDAVIPFLPIISLLTILITAIELQT